MLPGLGVQVSAVSRRFFRQKRRTRFVPMRDVESVIIHEGLSKWNVHYYLGIVTGKGQQKDGKDDGRIVVAFEVSSDVPSPLTSDDTASTEYPETRVPRRECGASERTKGGPEHAALILQLLESFSTTSPGH